MARSANRTQAAPSDGVRLWFPGYGPIAGIIGYVVFFLVIDAIKPAIVTTVTDLFTSVSPSQVGTMLAVFLWFIFGLTVFGITHDQLRKNPYEFTNRYELQVFIEEHRLPLLGYVLYTTLAVLGGIISLALWPSFIEVFSEFVLILSGEVSGVADTVTARDALTFVGFFLAFGAFSHGIDRLIIGGIRELIVRRSM